MAKSATSIEKNFILPELFATNKPGRQYDIIVESGQGKLVRGTLMEFKSLTKKYIKWDGTNPTAGVLAEDVDATSADAKSICFVEVDLNQAAVAYVDSLPVPLGWYPDSSIMIKELS